MNQSEKYFNKAKKLIPGGVNSPVRAFRSVGGLPFFTTKANGATLTTVDGTELIDFVGTWGPAIHGHNNAEIRKAISTALESGTSFGTPNPYEIEMAELIIKHVPSIEKIRMVNSGTEATMSCIRLARGFTGRDKIIKFAGCYHGHVDSLLVKAGSGAIDCGYPDSAGIPTSFANETIVLPFNNLSAVEEAFQKYKDEIAAVILEPYMANVGLIFPGENYLTNLRKMCSDNDCLLIFDEVMTGFRIGLGGVQEKENIKPDLTALGKIIGGGLPVGAFGGKSEIMDRLAPDGPVYQAGTLSGNPLALAAGIASLKLLENNLPYNRLNAVGKKVQSALLQCAIRKGLPLQVPQVGSMFALFFNEIPVTNFDIAVKSKNEIFSKIFHSALDKGIYLAPSPFETCFISTQHTDENISKTLEVLTTAINNI